MRHHLCLTHCYWEPSGWYRRRDLKEPLERLGREREEWPPKEGRCYSCEARLSLGCSRSQRSRSPERRPMRSEVGGKPIPLGLDSCCHWPRPLSQEGRKQLGRSWSDFVLAATSRWHLESRVKGRNKSLLIQEASGRASRNNFGSRDINNGPDEFTAIVL